MRKIALSLTLAAALAVAGCAQQIADQVNILTGALTSPQAQQAIANAKALGEATACFFASVDAGLVTVNDAVIGAVKADATLAAAVNAKQATAVAAVNGVVQVAYVANAAVCKALGGAATTSPGAS